MASVKISAPAEIDFEEYIQGDTFDPVLEFFSDDKFTVPEDVSGLKFFMDIVAPDNCVCSTKLETLSTDNGEITYGTSTNQINIKKVLTSPANIALSQSIRSDDGGGVIKTRIKGTLFITPNERSQINISR